MRRVILICFVAILSSNLKAQITDSIFWDGKQRTYKFFLPTAYTGAQKIPLVISLHPGFSNADNHMNAAKWQLIGDTANFISVYPNGTSNQPTSTNFSWNAYNLSTGSSADDVGFLNALLDSMITNFAVDTCRIYISGFSNGAWMSWRMMCDFTNRFAAVAPLSGSWKYGKDGFCDHGGCNGSTIPGTNPPSQEATMNCTPFKRMPYMYYRGTNEVNLTDRAITDPNGIYFWSRHNGCDTIPTVDTINSNGDQIIRERYLNCQDSTETIIMNVVENSHTWHASATNEFWKFLRKYSKCSGIITSGVSNIDNYNKFEIYPNPTNSTLFIKTAYISKFQFSIFNAMGQVIMQGRLNDNTIDVFSLQSGIYFILLKDEKGQWFNSKFIKE
jgi:polyhydroxybutyrate depolymerase